MAHSVRDCTPRPPAYSLLRLLIAVVCAGVAGGGAPAAQQTSAQQPQVTFSAEVNFVEVHAIATDRAGAFVKGLTAEDFEILEDGRPQMLSTFALVDLPVGRPSPLKGAAEAVESDVRATTHTFDGRIYVFLLDDLHTDVTRSLLVREMTKQFIQQYLGDNDLAAVVYTSGRQEAGQELTSSRRLLLAALDRFQGEKLPSAGAEKLALHLRATGAADVLGESSQPIRTNEGLQRAQTIRDPYDAQRGLNAQRALQAVENVANWLRDVQGRRKALLYVSEGLDYDIYTPFNLAPSASSIVTETQEAIGAALRSNVNVYGIDPRGLSQFSGLVGIGAMSDYPQLEYGTFRGALRELRLSQESLISLSDETGGLAIVNAGDLRGGLARIVLDNSRYYLLGYRSDSAKWSNRFVKIDVRVKRPDVTVRARRGFLPADPKAVSRAREVDAKAGTSPALKAALSRPVPVGDLPFRVFAAPFRAAGSNGSVLLAIEIDGPSLRFREADGRFNEKLEVSIVAADEKARVRGEDRQEFDLKLQPETYERVRRTGVRLLSRLTVPPGRYQIHVGAYETTGGTTGTVPYDLEVTDSAKAGFGLSGILLTSSIDPLVTANPDPLLKDALTGAPIARRRFSTTENLSAYVEAYVAPRQASAVTLILRVHAAADGRKVFELTDRRDGKAADRVNGFRADIPLTGWSPGHYVLDVEATSGTAVSRRSLPFEVADR
jgi:VWFA-related protein